MDLDLRVSDLLLPATPDAPFEHAMDVHEGGVRHHVEFRLPTGADLEDAATVAARDGIAAGARRILDRAVLEVTRDGDAKVPLPSTLERTISSAMATRDPQAELTLRLVCPSCSNEFETLLDAASFFFAEIAARVQTLFREIHLLARHYHWSESEILALTSARRQRYLSLISEEIDARATR